VEGASPLSAVRADKVQVEGIVSAANLGLCMKGAGGNTENSRPEGGAKQARARERGGGEEEHGRRDGW